MIDMRKGNYRAVAFSVQRVIFPLPPLQLFGEGVTQPLIVAFRIECMLDACNPFIILFQTGKFFFLYRHGFMLQYVATRNKV